FAVLGSGAKQVVVIINRLLQLRTGTRTLAIRCRPGLRTPASGRAGVQDGSYRPRAFLMFARKRSANIPLGRNVVVEQACACLALNLWNDELLAGDDLSRIVAWQAVVDLSGGFRRAGAVQTIPQKLCKRLEA